MSWSDKYKRSINCDNPNGVSQKAHCAAQELETGLKKLDDTSYDSIDQLMRRIMKKNDMTAKQLHNAFVDKHDKTPDDWINEGTLHHWFKGSKSKNGKPGWVQADGSPCANEPGETKTPKCFSSGRLRSLRKKGKKGLSLIKAAVRRKRKIDQGQQQKSGAAKPTNVPTFAKGKKDTNYVKSEPGVKESMKLNEASKDKPEKGSGKKDACYTKVKSRYSVWPSAYASGALVKCRKVGASNWGTKSEQIEPIDEKCWDRYEKRGMKKKGKKMVANCVLVKEDSATSLDYDWDTPVRERPDRYCPKCEKLELRNECKYGVKYWDMFSLPAEIITNKKDYHITMPYAIPNSIISPSSLYSNQNQYNSTRPHPANEDYEYSMARSELNTIMNAAKRLKKKMGKGEGNIEAWVQSKITKAADYIDTAADYIDSGESKVNEDVTIEDANGNTFIRIIDIIKADRLVKETSDQTIPGGKSKYNFPYLPKENPENVPLRLIKGKEPILPLAKGEGGSPYEPYKAPKEDPKNPYVPAPKRPKLQLAHYESEGTYFGKTLSQFMTEASAAWQRKEGKNPEGGLNKKGIASYRKQHPGSHLSLAVTTPPSKLKPGSKSAKRRKSFCARMGGMPGPMKDEKGRPTRKALSLRKWNC